MLKTSFLVVAIPVLLALQTAASAAPIFSDDFESGLGSWHNNGGGITVADPVRANNTVLTFRRTIAAGDLFTANAFPLVSGVNYEISFEYLGLAQPNSVPGDFGGFAGVSTDFAGSHKWYYGTALTGGAEDDPLIDDGRWRTYVYSFTAPIFLPFGNVFSNNIRLMFEDFIGSGDVPHDAYFDNVQLRVAAVPEPTSAALFLALIAFAACWQLGLAVRARRHSVA